MSFLVLHFQRGREDSVPLTPPSYASLLSLILLAQKQPNLETKCKEDLVGIFWLGVVTIKPELGTRKRQET